VSLVEFTDDEGIRWTVDTPIAGSEESAPRSGPTDLEFVSETGEHRTYTVLALAESSWQGVNELAWRVLLRRARSGAM
jgi:hypothetical protein